MSLSVLHVYRTYFPDPPGGLQEAIRQIAIATRKEGIKAQVFTLSPSPHPECLEIDGITVIRAKSWAAPASCDLGDWNAFRRFSTLATKADVIHFHFPWPFGDVLNLWGCPSKPKVMTYHSDIVRQRLMGLIYRPLMQYTLGNMDAVVATSPAYAKSSEALSEHVRPEHLRVIPLGINESSYPASEDARVLQRLGLAHGEPFLLFIGVLRYYKGLHTLLAAAARTRGKVVIAGSGPEEKNLQDQAQKLGLRNVMFTGRISDAEKVALLTACRALVLPSHLRSEAYGMVLVEASLFAKPMISCEIGTGTSFINKHDETGLVVPPEDPWALAMAMNTLLTDVALAQRFGAAARKRYEFKFSGPALGKAYGDLYREVAAK